MIATSPITEVNRTASFPVDHLSPSSIKDFLGCPRRWAFRRVEKLPEVTSPSLHLGKCVHAGLEAANRMLFREERVATEVILETYRRQFDALEETEGPVDWKGNDQREKLLLSGERILKDYLESDSFEKAGKPLAVEVRLSMDIPGTSLELIGYVDRVNADGTPVDFKTIASTPDIQNELWQHELQLTAYSELIEAATGQACPGGQIVFLVKTKEPKVIPVKVPAPGAIARQRFWSLVDTVVDGIRSERYHPQPGMHCSWCSFRNECSAWCGKGRCL